MADTRSSKREQLFKILKDFSNAMLVTRSQEGILRSRPMSLAEADPNGHIYFVSGIDSPKVQELEADPRVNVVLQGKTQFLSLSGTIRVIRDRAIIDRLWSESWKVWFPEGKNDPNLCILSFDPEEGEFWDNQGAKGLKYAFEAVKAYVTGTTPATDASQNAKVTL